MSAMLIESIEQDVGGAAVANDFLTPEQFAEVMKISRRTVYRWLKARQIPGAFQLQGSLWRIPREAIQQMREAATKKDDDSK